MKTAKQIRRFVDRELLSHGVPVGLDPLAEGLLDSLAVEQLIAYLEESFDIEFDDEELVAENFATIDVVARFVDSKRTARK
jgi:hypothetical protein